MGIYYPFLGGGRTCNQITTPLVYDESLSVEQQIACLFGKIANIDSDFVTTVEFDDFKSQSEEKMADLDHETNNRRGGGYAPRSRRGR